jgi:3-isopropylmalate/(R)-2-methylmalate dehydratase large subunit
MCSRPRPWPSAKLKVRRIEVDGKLQPGVYAKDRDPPHHPRPRRATAASGYAYEYAGTTFDAFSLEERMTVCNMAIEGGARAAVTSTRIQKTFDYLKGKPYAPKGADLGCAPWPAGSPSPPTPAASTMTSRSFKAEDIRPTVTWGITPGQAVFIDERCRRWRASTPPTVRRPKTPTPTWSSSPNTPIKGTKVDVCFLGSCTNGRISDLREAAKYLKGRKVSPSVQGHRRPRFRSCAAIQAVNEGLDKVFTEAGFEWRGAGCSMCLAMNPDKLVGDQLCASSSNRNFKGRQGSQTGRTVLMSPIMVVAAAITGQVADAREVFKV